jgi:hypothetical protein
MKLSPYSKRRVLDKYGNIIRHEVLVVDEEAGVYVFRLDPELDPNQEPEEQLA